MVTEEIISCIVRIFCDERLLRKLRFLRLLRKLRFLKFLE